MRIILYSRNQKKNSNCKFSIAGKSKGLFFTEHPIFVNILSFFYWKWDKFKLPIENHYYCATLCPWNPPCLRVALLRWLQYFDWKKVVDVNVANYKIHPVFSYHVLHSKTMNTFEVPLSLPEDVTHPTLDLHSANLKRSFWNILQKLKRHKLAKYISGTQTTNKSSECIKGTHTSHKSKEYIRWNQTSNY